MKPRYLLAALASVAFASTAQQPDEAVQPISEMQGQMQARFEEMSALMERIHGTVDSAEQRRLMAEHMQAMRAGITTMGRMMGGGAAGAQSSPGSTQCAENDMQCRMGRMRGEQQMMGERMAMMQQMMQQMMDHMTAQRPETQAGETRRERGQDRSERQTQEQDQGHEAHH